LFKTTEIKQQKKNLSSINYTFTKVSWYGKNFNGNKTANGEIFNSDQLTCASTSLPFNTKIKIINLSNNKSVIVRVNDRGPFKIDSTGKLIRPLQPNTTRSLDLSEKAFSTISNLSKGVISVKYTIVL
jgi:rare lipoprotein A